MPAELTGNADKAAPKTLLLGMGSPILSDDGVGLLVVRSFVGRIPGLDVDEAHITGLGLLDRICGFDRLFLADAMISENAAAGEVLIFPPSTGTLHLASSHGLDFADLLEMGKSSGLAMPTDVTIYGIPIKTPVAFGEELTGDMAVKFPRIVNIIEADIRRRMAIPF